MININIQKNKDLTQYSSAKLVCFADYIEVENKKTLAEILKYCLDQNIHYHLLGACSNQVLVNTENKLFIKLNFPISQSMFEFDEKSNFYFPANTKLSKLTSMCAKYNLIGWDVITGIPAELGGAIYMNAGTNLGEISSILDSIEIMNPQGEIQIHQVKQSDFSYRHNHFLKQGEIILGAHLKYFGQDLNVRKKVSDYLILRNKTQPMDKANYGCVFKNISPEIRSGKLLDELGFKGRKYKNLEVSLVHANFINNLGGATAQDYLEFVNLIKKEVLEKTKLVIEEEIKFY